MLRAVSRARCPPAVQRATDVLCDSKPKLDFPVVLPQQCCCVPLSCCAACQVVLCRRANPPAPLTQTPNPSSPPSVPSHTYWHSCTTLELLLLFPTIFLWLLCLLECVYVCVSGNPKWLVSGFRARWSNSSVYFP